MFRVLHWIVSVPGLQLSRLAGVLLGMLMLPAVAQSHAFLHLSEIECLALNIYHEARGEPVDGQIAVGIVTLNRVESRRYPNSVCMVVHQRKQFSWTRLPARFRAVDNPRAWRQAREVAERVLAGDFTADDYRLDGVMHYHNHTVSPQWAAAGELVTAIGRHRFYLL